MKVLVACEESQRVCKAFRDKGHEAYSCDILEPSGGHPEWHILGDAVPLVNGNCTFRTMDGATHTIDGKWDLLIAHPPCTYLTVSGNAWFDIGKYGDQAKQRYKDRYKAIVFFMQMVTANARMVAVENPIGIMSTAYKKPTQIIQPFQFGHPYTKQTCLWLKGLKKLVPTNILEKPESGWVNQSFTPDGRYGGFKAFNSSEQRSKTFPGIAKAMAEQWGTIVADRKTENSSEKPNNCEHITEDGVTCAKYPACDDCLDNPLNKIKGSERLVKGSEQTDCQTCKWWSSYGYCVHRECKGYEPKTERSSE